MPENVEHAELDPLDDIHGPALEPPVGFAPWAMTVTLEVGDRTVRFDGASHQSQEPRAWITCAASGKNGFNNVHHPGCHKYRMLKQFDHNAGKIASWLIAWDMLHRFAETRQDHYRLEPTDKQVQMILDRLPPIHRTE